MRTFIYQIEVPPSEAYKIAKSELNAKSGFALDTDHSTKKDLNHIDFLSVDPDTQLPLSGPGLYVLLTAGKKKEPKTIQGASGTETTWTSIQINTPHNLGK